MKRPPKPPSGPRRARVDIDALIEQILAHYRKGLGFAYHHLLPDDHQGAADRYSRAYLDQARLLDLITRIVKASAPSPQHAPENPTTGVLDRLIGCGAVTDDLLITEVLSVNAHMLLIGADAYVTGLGYPRLSIARVPDQLKPLLAPPAVRVRDLTPEPIYIPGLREHDFVYFSAASGEPRGKVPHYPVTLAQLCGLRGVEASTIYSLTSGARRDWVLDRARLRPRPSCRELLFEPIAVWRWLHSHQRD
jgi:hypothetical protein